MPDQTLEVAEINSPALTSVESDHVPAITTIEQAQGIVNSLQQENTDRALLASRIKSKYDSEKPYSTTQLKADGLSWRTNMTTRPLPMLIEKVVPRFTGGVKRMKFLTSAALPETVPNAAEKTDAFRREITETIRSREGWEDFVFGLALENCLFGYISAGWTDRYSWLPRSFSLVDSFLVPTGTKHYSEAAQVICLRETFMVHELFDTIRDQENAKLAGWDVDNVLDSINNAIPEARRSTQSNTPQNFWADLRRECSTLGAYTGTKAVAVWHVFVTEVDGGITHVAYDEANKKKLFWKVKQFERMSDISCFFSFQHGNGKLQGSKGIGRELYGMAGVLDRARNETVDRLMLSGKLVVQCAENQINRFRMSVVGSVILIQEGYSIQESKIDSNVKDFFALDEFLSDLLDQNAGSTSPKALTGDRVTKAAVELNAATAEERSDALLDRFLTQFARMVSTIQRRMCNPDTLEKDALAMQKRLLDVMSPEELKMISDKPAINTVQDYTDRDRQQIVVIASEARGNPLYKAREMERRKLAAIVSDEFAESVLLPENDPTEQAEQSRFQQLENPLIVAGQEVAISPRDNHAIHLAVIQQKVQGIAQMAMQDPGASQALAPLMAHAQQHLAALEVAGPKPVYAQFKQWFDQTVKGMEELAKHDAEVAAQAAPLVPGAPPGLPGQPPMA